MTHASPDALPNSYATLANSSALSATRARQGGLLVPAVHGVEIRSYEEDLRRPAAWTIDEPRNVVVVHKQGRIDRLQTRVGGRTRRFKSPLPGDVWLIPANERYDAHAQGSTIEYFEMRVGADLFRELGMSGEPDSLPLLQAHRDELLHQMALRLDGLTAAGDDLSILLRDSLRMSVGLHLLQLGQLRRKAKLGEPTRELDTRVKRRLEDYIDAHLGERIVLGDLAAIADLSRQRLFDAFKHSFGVSPIQYVIARRVRRAQGLLRERDRSLADVALDCGFFSHSHMSSVFRKHLGVAPSELRS